MTISESSAPHMNEADNTSQVIDRFMLPEESGFFGSLDGELSSSAKDIEAIGKTFRESLETAIRVSSIPFLLESQSVARERFGQLYAAESIRALKKVKAGEGLSKELQAEAASIARKKMNEEAEQIQQRDATLSRLRSVVFDDETRAAAAELLAQTLVMLWGAFEVLFSDVVRSELNREPALAVSLTTQEATRKHFPRSVALDVLAAQDFDLRARMGDVILGEQSIDSLQVMRDVSNALLPLPALFHKVLAQEEMWLLWQRRHLIVHRRGVADGRYIARTGDKSVKSGERLDIRSSYVERAAMLCRDAAIAFLQAWREQHQQTK